MKANALVAVVLGVWAWGGSVGIGQQEKPAAPKTAKTAKKAPSPNEFRLTVVTRTGSGNKYGRVGHNKTKIFVSINGSDTNSHRLHNRGHDDFQVGAIDTFEKLRFDYPIDEIKFIQVKVEGDDMWNCEWISFQFFKGGKQSKVYKFPVNRFLSGASEKKVFRVVSSVQFKLTPTLEGPAETAKRAEKAKPAEKEPTKVE